MCRSAPKRCLSQSIKEDLMHKQTNVDLLFVKVVNSSLRDIQETLALFTAIQTNNFRLRNCQKSSCQEKRIRANGILICPVF